ncbi:MAG: hypothetical protein WEB88_06380 [Gemmatimonadota bacterium]
MMRFGRLIAHALMPGGAASGPAAAPVLGRCAPALALAVALLTTAAAPADAQRPGGRGAPPDTTGAGGAPLLAALVAEAAEESDLRVAVRRFEADRRELERRYDVPLSPVLIDRLRVYHEGWLARVDALDPAGLNPAGQAQYQELRADIQAGLAEQAELDAERERIAPLVPFARPLQELQERRRARLDVEARAAAQTLEDARKEVLRLTEEVGAGAANGLGDLPVEVVGRAIEHLDELRQPLESWYEYYYSFDPLFTWWVRMPYEELNTALDVYEAALRARWPAAAPPREEG